MKEIVDRLHENRRMNESHNLSFEDLKAYQYTFRKIWKSSPNSTYGDDFLELAEQHNCLQLYTTYKQKGHFFVCKDKEDYESLKDALSQSNILRSFITLSPLKDMDWDELASNLTSIYVDKYIGGYSVKIPKQVKESSVLESSSSYTWGDWQHERGSDCRVKFYCSGMDLTNQIIGVVYEETASQPYYGAEIYDNSTASTIEERADDSYHFDSEEAAVEWVEEWFKSNHDLSESEDYDDSDEEEDTTLQVGDKVKINIEELEASGISEMPHQREQYNYILENPDEVYTIDRIHEKPLYHIILDHPIVGKTAFEESELIFVD